MKTMKLTIKIALAALLLLLPVLSAAQTNFLPPTVTAGAANAISWTAGTVNNGGHPVAVAAGTSTVTLNKTDCTSPLFANCNFVYANSVGTVAVTTTLATAIASGNSLLALIETGAVTTTQVVYPWQSGTLWLQAAGPQTTLTAPVITGGLTASGAVANDFSGSTGAFKTSTGAVTVGPGAVGVSGQATFSAGILASGAVANDFSGSTGAFKTSTGAVTIGPGAVTQSGATTFSVSATSPIFSTSTAGPSSTGVVRLANAELVGWRNAGGGGDITLAANASNNLVLTGATAPTDGYYFVGPENCSMALTTGTFAANPATSGAQSAPAMVRAASGNTILQLTTTAAANTTDVVCDITPPSRLTSGKGITINSVSYLFGYQTTALTSIGTFVLNSITYHAPGATAQGTVAAIGGALTPNGGINHGTPPTTTTTGQCYNENVSLGTPYAVTTDLTRVAWQNTFVQSAASATVMQICGSIVYYSNINSL